MDNFAIGRQAIENYIFVVVKLNHHVFRFPIYVPSLLIDTMKKNTFYLIILTNFILVIDIVTLIVEHTFIVLNLHVLIWSAVLRVKRMILFEATPRSSSRFSP